MNKTYYIQTYGCAMNYADANSIRNLLNNLSLKEVNNWQDADVVILVTCSVRQQAEDKVSGWGIKAKKEKFKNKTVVLTGCMALRYDRKTNQISKKYKQQILKKFDWIDHIINIREIDKLPKILEIDNYNLLDTPNINYDQTNKYQGLFSTSHGCDNFCSYCIVPYTRGKLINFPKEQIIDNVEKFVNNGGKLVTLLGQNVNSWEDDNKNFTDLLREIENVKGDFWINFLSSHPRDITDELIELITTHDKFLKHCNIAVQSGSDRILKLMNRLYQADEFVNICKKIKSKNSRFRITTDAIVGFPTETEDDFLKTKGLISKCNIEMVYIGKYSPRKGTAAYRLKDTVTLETKKKREKILRDIVNRTRLREHKKLVGEKIPVLMYTSTKGISYYNHDVLTKDSYEPGQFYNLLVKNYHKSGLIC